MHARVPNIEADNATSADTGPNRIFDFMKIKRETNWKREENGHRFEKKKKQLFRVMLISPTQIGNGGAGNTKRAFPRICRKCNHRLLWRYEDNAPISNPIFPQEWISPFFFLHKSLMRYNSAYFFLGSNTRQRALTSRKKKNKQKNKLYGLSLSSGGRFSNNRVEGISSSSFLSSPISLFSKWRPTAWWTSLVAGSRQWKETVTSFAGQKKTRRRSSWRSCFFFLSLSLHLPQNRVHPAKHTSAPSTYNDVTISVFLFPWQNFERTNKAAVYYFIDTKRKSACVFE